MNEELETVLEGMKVNFERMKTNIVALEAKQIILNKRFTHHIDLMDAHKEPVKE